MRTDSVPVRTGLHHPFSPQDKIMRWRPWSVHHTRGHPHVAAYGRKILRPYKCAQQPFKGATRTGFARLILLKYKDKMALNINIHLYNVTLCILLNLSTNSQKWFQLFQISVLFFAYHFEVKLFPSHTRRSASNRCFITSSWSTKITFNAEELGNRLKKISLLKKSFISSTLLWEPT